MKNLKKVLIFIIILILVNSIIYIYPLYKIASIYNTEQDTITSDKGINPNYGRITNILTSDIDDNYKRDAMLIFTEDRNIRDEQRNEFYQILVYCGAIINIIVALIGYFIRKKYTDKKYIGSAFMFSSILFVLLLTLIYQSINL